MCFDFESHAAYRRLSLLVYEDWSRFIARLLPARLCIIVQRNLPFHICDALSDFATLPQGSRHAPLIQLLILACWKSNTGFSSSMRDSLKPPPFVAPDVLFTAKPWLSVWN